MLPEEMANQSVKLKEEQLRREEEKLREIELKVQREIQLKRQELLAKEDSLKVLEARLGELFTLIIQWLIPRSSAKSRLGVHVDSWLRPL
jgi:hypothetical protein